MKISEMQVTTPAEQGDIIPMVRNGENRSITPAALAALTLAQLGTPTPKFFQAQHAPNATGAAGLIPFIPDQNGLVTLAEWKIILNPVVYSDGAILELYRDVFGAFILLDSYTVPNTTGPLVVNRPLSAAVPAGQICGLLVTNTFSNPQFFVTHRVRWL